MSNELTKSEAFANGLIAGINLYQLIVIAAHKHREPLLIGENLYYLESGRERLERAFNEICK